MRRLRVVVVDDVEMLRTLLRMSLPVLAAVDVVGEAADGMEGLEVVGSLGADAVTVDLSMPRMGGLELVRRLRARNPALRIVVWSGFESAVMAENARRAGADAYVQKGGDLDELAAALLEGSAPIPAPRPSPEVAPNLNG